ncbi:glycosyltransferase [Arachidicoccus terrestris]|uniref:glycosyltransferase n=1 Tax=Arachidicoccus terrestris TaxID=2875539 RepID=UPI001CC38515|nr:glycosyltransferase [Arachidicoccus terrestris]UAY54566.1 glycosyltransferase [Arachidicoccus terrestris]
MINVLWLPSWYPTIESQQNGDFIYRHALAASNFAKLAILFVQPSSKVDRLVERNFDINNNISERVLLFPRLGRFRVFNFIALLYLYNKEFKSLYKNGIHPNIIHVHVSFRAGLIALWLKRRYQIPYIITEHWSYFNKPGNLNYANSSFFIKWTIKKIFRKADYILPVSNDLSSHLKRFFPFINPIVVPNVVDPALFYLTKACNNRREFKFIHVSSLNELKQPYKIVTAFEKIRYKYKRAVLEVVGPASSELMEYVCELGLPKDSIVFYGLKEHEEVASLIREANAFVLYSTTENLPCVILESLCCGVPVISSSVGGVPEMVDDSNGILVPPGDEEVLYKAMESMILNYDKYNRQRISEDAQAKYNPEVVGRQIVEVYEKVLKKK